MKSRRESTKFLRRGGRIGDSPEIFVFFHKRIETNLQREEAVAGEGVVLLACHPRPWEKVELVDEKEKGEEDEVKKEKVGLASKVNALLTKLRPEKKEEEVKEEEVKVEEVKEDEKKEEEMEEKPAVEEKPVRRGSETPV